MIQMEFESLRALGLTPALVQLANAVDDPDDAQSVDDLRLMRLTEVHRESVRVHDGGAEHGVRVLPRLLRELAEAGSALAVGDWVLCGIDAFGEYRVHARVPPLCSICRRDADGRRHPVVSNVDTALLVMGLDDDFNLRRLERYLALVQASGVLPVVVLTKADVASRTPGLIESRIAALRGRVSAQVDVLAVDGTDPATAPRLAAWLSPGQTVVVLGSSGAGKSTLTNNLLGAAVQDTCAVRAHDGRGKHTTTSRSLHRLSGGACVIDTPGLRTLRPDADEATLAAMFEDIEALALQCRFRDCGHRDEPGCAVREGVDPDRLKNFQKLLREARRDTLTVLEKQQQASVWKQRGKANKARTKFEREQR